MPKAKNEPTKNKPVEEKKPEKEVYWQDNLRQTISALVSKAKDIGTKQVMIAGVITQEAVNAVGVRIPGLAAAVLYAVNVTLLSPHVSSAFGVYAFELLKDLGTAFIWKLLDSPEVKSEYYHSGKLEADIKRLLEKDHEYELEKKIGIILRDTQAIQITLDELNNKADEKALKAFLDEIKKYPEIYRANGENVSKWASMISLQFATPITKKVVLREFNADWEKYTLQQEPIPRALPVKDPIPAYTPWNFPWGRWIFFWVLSVLIGAVIIVLVVSWLFGLDNSQAICIKQYFTVPLPLALTSMPIMTQTVLATIVPSQTETPDATVTATLTFTPTLEATDTSTPTKQNPILLFTTVGHVLNDDQEYTLTKGTEVFVVNPLYRACIVSIKYENKIVLIPANALYENRDCP